MLHLDEARERVVECLRGFLRGRSRSWRVLLVSDVRARFRVVLWCPKTHRNSAAEELESLLAEAGGTCWSGDVLQGQAADDLPDGPWQSRVWDEAADVGDVRGLRLVERHLSKAGWFDAPAEAPWLLRRGKSNGAPISGFYSFKGGVGRSTALAATAVQFAAQGLRVAVVDGDLDSPGVGSLLHGHDGTITQAGVVDYLIEAPLHENREECRLDDFFHRCPPDLHRGRGEILVFPAGTLGQRYVGKLARLDYGPNVLEDREHPFVRLLRKIRADLAPDWILIDARAGLGEVSGFLTGGLCHLYLVFGSLSGSSWRGLELVIDRLGGERLSRGESQCECLLVAAMVPSAEVERAKELWRLMLVRRLSHLLSETRRHALEPVLAPMAAELGDVFTGASNLQVNPTAALDELEARLETEDRWVFVGYDEPDMLGDFDWKLNRRLVRVLVAFWSDYSRRWRRIRAKVFLRSDLFRRHAGMGSADFAKLAANRVELTWSDADILGMLVKRIANTSDGLADYCRRARIAFEEDARLGLVPRVERPDQANRLIERLAGEFMGANRKKGLVRNWVLDHLRDGAAAVSPRNFVRLFELAAANESANQAPRPPRLLHPTALRQALDDVSLNHVRQEKSSEWPWLDGLEKRLRREPLAPWSREKMLSLLDAGPDEAWGTIGDTPVGPPEEGGVALPEYLVELGILRRRSDDRLDVPDLYLRGLGLRRKGGVKFGTRRRRGRGVT